MTELSKEIESEIQNITNQPNIADKGHVKQEFKNMESEINSFTALKTKVESLEKELELLDSNEDNAKDSELASQVESLHKVIKQTTTLVESKVKQQTIDKEQMAKKEKHDMDAEFTFDPMASKAFDWDNVSDNLQM